MKTYLVGGAVRDELLGIESFERDWVVVGSSPQEMLALGYKQVGKDFPVFLHPKTKEEYALARTERKTGLGYTGFEFNANSQVTLEEDLMRRDLTINAIAMDEDGIIIDPYGGVNDVKKKLLRHVSDSFSEDPLRLLRVGRFAAKFKNQGFAIHQKTFELMKKISTPDEINALVPERVWIEMLKVFKTQSPSIFFFVLRECGALKYLMPEVDKLFSVPQTKKYHPEIDTGIHTMMVVDQSVKLTSDVAGHFAALCHDLGKSETPKELLPKHHGHEERSIPLVKALSQRLKVPKSAQDLALQVAKYHTLVHKVFELRPKTILNLLINVDAFRRQERFYLFLLVCKADSLGRLGFTDSAYPQRDFLLKIHKKCGEINASGFISKGLQGKEIADAINMQRLELIKNLQEAV